MKTTIEYGMTTEDGLIIQNSNFINAKYLAIYFNGKRLTNCIDYYNSSENYSIYVFCDHIADKYSENGSDVHFVVDWE